MDTELCVFDREPQLYSWTAGPLLGYPQENKTTDLSNHFNTLSLILPKGTFLYSAGPAKAVAMLREQKAGVFVFSAHTVRDFSLLELGDIWDRAAATVGPHTPVEVIAWKNSNQSRAIQSALVGYLNLRAA
jgi:hypothetical protein